MPEHSPGLASPASTPCAPHPARGRAGDRATSRGDFAMPPGQAWADRPSARERWVPSKRHLAAMGQAAAPKHRSTCQLGPVVEASAGGFVLGPRQEPSQPRLAATPRDTAGSCPWTPSPSLLQAVPAQTHCGGTADLRSADRSSNSTVVLFFKCKAILEVLGVASYKLQEVLSSPDSSPLQKVMQTAGREGEERSSSGDKTGTHGNAPVYVPSSHKAQYPASWLQTPAS